MYSQSIKILNKAGLHARPASLFIKTAAKFNSDIYIKFSGKTINAKSIVSVLSAGINSGSEIEMTAEGADEKAAIKSLVELIHSNFGEAF